MADIRETSVNYVAGEGHITYSSNEHKYVERLRKQIAKNPDGVEILMDDPELGLQVHLPKSWFREPKAPPARRVMTAEERAAAVERLARARERTGG